MDAEITSSPLPSEIPRTPVELRPTNMRRSDTENRVTKPSRVARITSSLSSASRTAMRRPTGLPLSSSSFTAILPFLRTSANSRSEEHTSELQSLMRISYAVFCLKKNNRKHEQQTHE